MTTRDEWLALAERFEKATGPDRALSNDLAVALGYAVRLPDLSRSYSVTLPGEKPYIGLPPHYAQSLDAITALAEQELPGRDIHSGTFRQRGCGMIMNADGTSGTWFNAATERLARCAAFCRAMAERAQQ